MKNNEFIKNIVMEIVNDYPISKVNLFGSRAAGTNREDSDVDLIHGPLSEDSMIEINEVIELYAT